MTREKLEELWTNVDAYIEDQLIRTEPALSEAIAASEAAELPSIAVSPCQGKLLMLMAKMCGAKRILELGTLGGYSTIWLARGLAPGGEVVTLESNPKHAEVARANIFRAGLAEMVEVRIGAALELLPRIQAEPGEPFDLTFIDADKEHMAEYFAWAVRLSRPGSVIIADNVVRDGEVIDVESTDARVRGVRAFFEAARAEPRVTVTAIQTVGVKGYDGFALALVK